MSKQHRTEASTLEVPAPRRRLWIAVVWTLVALAGGYLVAVVLEPAMGLPLYWLVSSTHVFASNTDLNVEAAVFAIVLVPPLLAIAALLVGVRIRARAYFVSVLPIAIGIALGSASFYLSAIHSMGIGFGSPPAP